MNVLKKILVCVGEYDLLPMLAIHRYDQPQLVLRTEQMFLLQVHFVQFYLGFLFGGQGRRGELCLHSQEVNGIEAYVIGLAKQIKKQKTKNKISR